MFQWVRGVYRATSGEVVEPTVEVNVAADETDENENLVRRPADDEAATDQKRRHDCVASGCAYCARMADSLTCRHHLQTSVG